ncbi:MAG: diphthamide biosynthesis enzyme Dph2 [Candidatus Methanofastidiosa archaeon]|nr:diphthamide biosynthesis enzyme Dph2 [Candidatus Methanofastidiosa archaeon]
MLVLDLDGLLEQVKAFSPRTIGIQLPAGLRQHAREISGFFDSRGYEVVFSGDPSYGACDVADELMGSLGVDLLVHFGHSRMLPSSRVPMIYWDVRDDVPILPTISGNIDLIESMGKKVGIATTIQHVHKLGEVVEFLKGRGMTALLGNKVSRVSNPGQVLGCSFETIKGLDVDFFVYIGTGYFHPIGIALCTDRPVLYCDPYTGACENVEKEKNLILRKRYAAIEKARSCTDFAVIVSSKRGQNRFSEALGIKKLLKNNGKNCQLIFAEEINNSIIQDFDFEVFVIAACPRIAIDDASNFDKPVLTVTEVGMMFSGEEYSFDEIHKI